MNVSRIFAIISTLVVASVSASGVVASKPQCDPCGKWDVVLCGNKIPQIACPAPSPPPAICDPCGKWDPKACGTNRPIPLIACTISAPIPTTTTTVRPKPTCVPCSSTWDVKACGPQRFACTSPHPSSTTSVVHKTTTTTTAKPPYSSVNPPKCDPCGSWDVTVCGKIRPMIACKAI